MSYPRIDLVVGTRPEAIKLAPIALALAAARFPLRLLLTGQHPIDPADHGLETLSRIAIDCPGQRNPMVHADRVARALRDIIAVDPPALLVVQGDTSSALGGALAGFAEGVPVAHVEAGLRSFDPAMPWPEEQNRVTIDRLSTLLFAPTETSAANLRADHVQGRISVTGNSGIDALLTMLARIGPAPVRPADDRLRLLVTCHRRENMGRPMRSVAAALNQLASSGQIAIRVVLHTNPAVADAMRRALNPNAAIDLLPPLTHAQMIDAMRSSDILLSDSGGVQEEAPALGIPLLVLRDKTERPEGIASGNMLLAGTDRDRIIALVLRLTDATIRATMSIPSLPYGDGKAGPRIAKSMIAWIAQAGQVMRAAG